MKTLLKSLRRIFKKKLRRVGFFVELPYGIGDAGSITDSVGKLQEENIEKIVSYLKDGSICTIAFGTSEDVMSTEHEILCSTLTRTDGQYYWPNDLSYYVKKYHVGLPQDFLDHMRKNNWTIPDVDMDTLAI
jgi:hypothetical protein